MNKNRMSFLVQITKTEKKETHSEVPWNKRHQILFFNARSRRVRDRALSDFGDPENRKTEVLLFFQFFYVTSLWESRAKLAPQNRLSTKPHWAPSHRLDETYGTVLWALKVRLCPVPVLVIGSDFYRSREDPWRSPSRETHCGRRTGANLHCLTTELTAEHRALPHSVPDTVGPYGSRARASHLRCVLYLLRWGAEEVYHSLSRFSASRRSMTRSQNPAMASHKLWSSIMRATIVRKERSCPSSAMGSRPRARFECVLDKSTPTNT